MSIGAINPGPGALGPLQPSAFQQQRTYFDQLKQSLGNGDLSGAQQAFSQLQQSLPNPPTGGSQGTNGNQSPGSQIQQDFAAVGQALQSGDVSGAQAAFAKFEQDVQSAHHGHHHHHRAQGAGGDQDQSGANQPGVNLSAPGETDTTATSMSINITSTFSTTA